MQIGMLFLSAKHGDQQKPRFGRDTKDTFTWVLGNSRTSMELGYC